MMLLKYLTVAVSYSKRVFGANNELIGVTRMLIVMDHTSQEGGEDVRKFEELLHICRVHQVMHALQ